VSFEVVDDFSQLNLCHCKQCQRATASAHASNLFTEPGNINWKTGIEYVKRFDVTDRNISNAFCANCGSGLPYVSKTGNSLVVPAGTLDASPGCILAMSNIFWSERADWYDSAIAAQHVNGFSDEADR